MNKMKHHLNPLIMLIMTPAVWLFSSCSQDDDVETLHATPLQINVTAQGFSSDNPETRATESGYTTTFSSGDKIGITVISSANAILQNNIPCTYNGSAWTPDNNATITRVPDATYLAYYPYSTTMNSKRTAAEILAAFTPKTDQSSYANYTASDLMTGTGTVSGTTLTIRLAHALGLIEVLPPTGATSVTINVGSPYKIDNSYRLIRKPGIYNLRGSYIYSDKTQEWGIYATLTAGKYAKISMFVQ
jgi:hypothetical protein